MRLVLINTDQQQVVREWPVTITGDHITLPINDLATALEIVRHSFRARLELQENDLPVKIWPQQAPRSNPVTNTKGPSNGQEQGRSQQGKGPEQGAAGGTAAEGQKGQDPGTTGQAG